MTGNFPDVQGVQPGARFRRTFETYKYHSVSSFAKIIK